jgi:hypothetical protein
MEKDFESDLPQPAKEFGHRVDAALGFSENSGQHFLDWYTAHVDKTADEVRRRALGPDAVDGPFKFVEGASQFTTGMLLAGELGIAAKGASLLETVGLQAAKGGVGTFLAFGPTKDRLANMIAAGPDWFGRPAAQFMATQDTDSEIAARLKNAAEGAVLNVAFYAGTEALSKSLRWMIGANKAQAFALSARAARTADAASAGKIDPDLASRSIQADLAEARRLSGTADPGASVESVRAADGSWTLKRVGTNEVLTEAPTFRTQAEADLEAQALNTGARNANMPGGQVGAETQPILERRVSGNMEEPAFRRRASDLGRTPPPVPEAAPPVEPPGGKLASPAIQARVQSMTPEGRVAFYNEVYRRIAAGEDAVTVADELLSNESALRTKNPSTVSESLTAIHNMADALPEITDASGKPIQTAQAARLVSDLSKSTEDITNFVRSAFGDIEKLPQRLAATRIYIVQAARTARETAKFMELNPDSPVAAKNAADALQTLYDLHTAIGEHAGSSTVTPEARAAQQAILEEQGAQGLTRRLTAARGSVFEGRTPKQVRQIIRQVMSSENPGEILDAINQPKDLAPQGIKQSLWLDRLNAYRMEAMLSGPRTQIVNAVSNAIAMLQRPVETWWAGAAPWRAFQPGSSALRQEGADMLGGILQNFGESFRAARRAWYAGENVLDPGRMHVDANAGQSMSSRDWGDASWLNRIFHFPSRMLMGTDEFFAQLNYRVNVRAQILAQARSEGVTDATELANRLVTDNQFAFRPNQAGLNPASLEYSRVSTFKNDLGEFTDATGRTRPTIGKSLQDFANAHPFFRQIMPFVRTPVNLARWSWERTPGLAYASKIVQADLAAGGTRAAVAQSKMELGGALIATAAGLTLTHVITGAGPTDPDLRKEWIDLGNQPYSINLGPLGHISFRRGDPTFTFLGIVADLATAGKSILDGDSEHVGAALVSALVGNFASKTFMQGLTQTFDALSGDQTAIQRWMQAYAGSYVPNAANQINPDSAMREVRGIMDAIMARTPGWSTNLEPRRNFLGDKVMQAPNYLNNTFNPFTWSKSHPGGAVSDELLLVGRALAMPPEKLDGIDLTDRHAFARKGANVPPGGLNQSPYDRWLELMGEKNVNGRSTLDDLTRMIESPAYQKSGAGTAQYPGGIRFRLLNAIVQAHKSVAFARMLSEYPSLVQAIPQARQEKAKALTAPPPGQQDTSAAGVGQQFRLR